MVLGLLIAGFFFFYLMFDAYLLLFDGIIGAGIDHFVLEGFIPRSLEVNTGSSYFSTGS